MQDVDSAAIPAAAKSDLRDGIAQLQKRVLEQAKAAGAANKRRAIDAAVAAAAAAGPKGFLVARLDVGLDTKAVQEAYKAVRDSAPKLPALFVTSDPTGVRYWQPLGLLSDFGAGTAP